MLDQRICREGACRVLLATSSLIVVLIVGVALGITACGGSSSEKPAKASQGSAGTTELIGFGATSSAWDENHQADDQFSAGSAYDPDPSLVRGGDQRYIDKYYGVIYDNPIIDYEMRFSPGTSIEAAKRSVLASEFPRDAKIVWFKRLDTCAKMIVRSKKVADAIRSAALVEFSSGLAADQYDPRDIWSAILMPIEVAVSSDNSGC
jgi:hypothetical protein